MGRPNKISISKELEQEVIAFYLEPNSAREVERKFGLNLYQLTKLLIKHNIKQHDTKTIQELKYNKFEQTLIEKYGVHSTFEIDSVQEKIKQKNIEKYGVEYALQNKERNIEVRKACEAKYGRSDVGKFGSVEHKRWIAQGDYLAKTQETCLKKYGVSNVMQNTEIKNKSFQRRKELHTLNISSIEHELFNILVKEFGNDNVETQYKDTRYPYNCDFYIKSEDLFIELNAHWTHGDHPFDVASKQDIDKLNCWKEKAANSKFYMNAIKTWTERDVNKLNTARENKLNYVMIYPNDWDKIKKEKTINEERSKTLLY